MKKPHFDRESSRKYVSELYEEVKAEKFAYKDGDILKGTDGESYFEIKEKIGIEIGHPENTVYRVSVWKRREFFGIPDEICLMNETELKSETE